MRTHGVVFPPEAIEDFLLRRTALLDWANRLAFESAVHSLVGSVLIRPSGEDALVLDPEPHPPDIEIRESVNGLGREGDTVVGPDRARQTVLAESSLEDGPSGHCLGGEEPVTGQEKSRVLVGDGEGVAVAPVAGLEFSLEVSGPEIVWSLSNGRNDSRVLMRTTATPLQH